MKKPEQIKNEKHSPSAAKKRVIVLGSGFVSRPIIHHLAKNSTINLTVASLYPEDIDKVTTGLKNVNRIALNVNHRPSLKKLLQNSDVVVSLLPANMHPVVASTALKTNNHFVSTSYLTDEMMEFHTEAIKKGLIFINECGMDPGLDHMSTMSLVNQLKKKKYEIVSYESYGSGIPAPEDNDNPWGYKFSWSPKGVIKASQNGAVYLKDGQKYNKLPGTIFDNPWKMKIEGLPELEAYPNRSAINYIQLYGLDGIHTMIRATLRYPGWSAIWHSLYMSGIINEYNFTAPPKTYREFFDAITEDKYKRFDGTDLKDKLNFDFPDEVIDKIEWLGLFDKNPIKTDKVNSIEILTDILSKKLVYKESERDLIILYHILKAKNEQGKIKTFSSKLISYGTPGGDSAMAKSVSLPSAVAVEAIIGGEIKSPGVHIPVIPEIYKPILTRLKNLGLEIKESKI